MAGMPEDLEEDEEFFPPVNFSMVEPGVYRSSFPMKRNFSFLKRIRLKTILALILEEYPQANTAFNEENGIRFLQFGMEGNKEPFRSMDSSLVRAAVRAIMDPANHPILIHCNEGKHRTGCLVGCLRKARHWALSSIFDEYMLYAGDKGRLIDQRFIELFELESSEDTAEKGRSKGLGTSGSHRSARGDARPVPHTMPAPSKKAGVSAGIAEAGARLASNSQQASTESGIGRTPTPPPIPSLLADMHSL
uniref:diphosphoinositol-polyphosphate diphosphatase n=1 Tax=Rhizochromulina marina TaxID=1034831 RepID=A0A7S2RJ85_9STRA